MTRVPSVTRATASASAVRRFGRRLTERSAITGTRTRGSMRNPLRKGAQLVQEGSLPIRIEDGESARQRADSCSPAHREGDAVVPRSGRVCGRPLQLVSEPRRVCLAEQVEEQVIVDATRTHAHARQGTRARRRPRQRSHARPNPDRTDGQAATRRRARRTRASLADPAAARSRRSRAHIAFLCSGANTAVTGEIIRTSGGQRS